MVAHAKCLWTAALSALGPAPLVMRTVDPGSFGAPCKDDERARTTPQGGRFTSRRDSGQSLPERYETLASNPSPSSPGLCAVAPLENRSPAARADRRSLEATPSESVAPHTRRTRGKRLPRSLSYLSLTLCCAALRTGWLEGCATPSSPSREMDAPAMDKWIDGGRDGRWRPEKVQTPHRRSLSMNCADFLFP